MVTPFTVVGMQYATVGVRSTEELGKGLEFVFVDPHPATGRLAIAVHVELGRIGWVKESDIPSVKNILDENDGVVVHATYLKRDDDSRGIWMECELEVVV